MAHRDPKTGRWIKTPQPEKKKEVEKPAEDYDFFDDTPTPPDDQDEDIMTTFIYVIVIFALVGLVCAFMFLK